MQCTGTCLIFDKNAGTWQLLCGMHCDIYQVRKGTKYIESCTCVLSKLWFMCWWKECPKRLVVFLHIY
jgi:hypothetical protein